MVQLAKPSFVVGSLNPHAVSGAGLWALVNNAGVSTFGEVEFTSMETYKQVSEVNLWGTIRITKALLPLIRRTRGEEGLQVVAVTVLLLTVFFLGTAFLHLLTSCIGIGSLCSTTVYSGFTVVQEICLFCCIVFFTDQNMIALCMFFTDGNRIKGTGQKSNFIAFPITVLCQLCPRTFTQYCTCSFLAWSIFHHCSTECWGVWLKNWTLASMFCSSTGY